MGRREEKMRSSVLKDGSRVVKLNGIVRKKEEESNWGYC